MRRWVVETGTEPVSAARAEIEQRISRRTGFALSRQVNTMCSSFRAEKRLAARMARGRIVLAGDSAHVVSPIGGQGMNLGWLDAWDAGRCLERILRQKEDAEAVWADYSRRRRRIARKAIGRAEFYMRVGHTSFFTVFKRPPSE